MPTLYLMMGYPGAGKTTTARYIRELTGATHLWADHIRRERYGHPSYSHSENLALYNHMNQLAVELLASGNDVVFDTSFNFHKDRRKLRALATAHKSNTMIVWVQTSKKLAKQRATKLGIKKNDTRVLGNMTPIHFDRITSHLEAPHPGEPVIKLDGTKISKDYVKEKLGI